MKPNTLRFLTILLVYLAVTVACALPSRLQGNSGAQSEQQQTQNGEQAGNSQTSQPGTAFGPALAGLNRDKLDNYNASFQIQFQGKTSWVYQLTTRKSGKMLEQNLHIEGIDKNQNPGDVRIVTDGETTWMIGPGTDNECTQFPNNQGMDPDLIVPEKLVSFADMQSQLAYVGGEEIVGRKSLHFRASNLVMGGWNVARIDSWQDTQTHALLRFTMQATGEDVFFNAGGGNLDARYSVENLNEETIQPVSGCEINVPLPNGLTHYVRLPGLASFEIQANASEITNFYQSALPQQGWKEKEPLAQKDTITLLNYSRDPETVQIQIQALQNGGCKVKLIFTK